MRSIHALWSDGQRCLKRDNARTTILVMRENRPKHLELFDTVTIIVAVMLYKLHRHCGGSRPTLIIVPAYIDIRDPLGIKSTL